MRRGEEGRRRREEERGGRGSKGGESFSKWICTPRPDLASLPMTMGGFSLASSKQCSNASKYCGPRGGSRLRWASLQGVCNRHQHQAKALDDQSCGSEVQGAYKFLFVVLSIEPRALCTLGKFSTAELHSPVSQELSGLAFV